MTVGSFRMTHFNSTDTAESEDTGIHEAETAGTEECQSAGGRSRRTDDGSTYRVRDGESVVAAVVRAVGSETRTDPTELRPLHSAIDTGALNDLFRSHGAGTPPTDGRVAFDYCRCRVRVGADGTIKIDRPG